MQISITTVQELKKGGLVRFCGAVWVYVCVVLLSRGPCCHSFSPPGVTQQKALRHYKGEMRSTCEGCCWVSVLLRSHRVLFLDHCGFLLWIHVNSVILWATEVPLTEFELFEQQHLH